MKVLDHVMPTEKNALWTAVSGFGGELKVLMKSWGTCIARHRPVLLVCFEGMASHSHRVLWRFVRGSRESSPVPSIYRVYPDALIPHFEHV